MSSDRALLESAARAAGMPATANGFHPRAGLVWIRRALGVRRETRWNPLVDSGDALDLAVKLGIKIELHPAWVYARAVIRGREYLQIEEGWAQGGDPYAATRLAIVRAAAAMAPHQEQP